GVNDWNVPRDGDAKAGPKRPIAEIEIVNMKSIECVVIEWDRSAHIALRGNEQAVQRLHRRLRRRPETVEEIVAAAMLAMRHAAVKPRPPRGVPICSGQMRCPGNADDIVCRKMLQQPRSKIGRGDFDVVVRKNDDIAGRLGEAAIISLAQRPRVVDLDDLKI